jgi:creatinine amidohydrolase
MRQGIAVLVVAVVVAAGFPRAQGLRPAAGLSLADLSWTQAEAELTPSSVVVIPLGVATVQHGPHLKLNNNERLARYLAGRVQTAAAVVVAPTLTYHYSPAFLEYPGSTSVSNNTSRDMTIDIVRSLARYGPRRFYVLNTGITTMFPLAAAAEALADHGILLGYTDMKFQVGRAPVAWEQTRLTGAAHADEIETSVMLYVDPAAVDMSKAVREYGPGYGPMTRQKDAPGAFSATGIAGDPTRATREKGRVVIDTLIAGILDDIEKVRTAPLPAAKGSSPAPAPAPIRTAAQPPERVLASGCTSADDRTIRQMGPRFSSLWREMDAEKIGAMFAPAGDIRHPDGMVERGADVIRQNRAALFSKKEYRGSIHPLQLNDIRCPAAGIAIADGKWELRLADPPGTKPYAGWCTLVLRGLSGTWSIEAWRYTVDPPPNSMPAPTILKKPGWPGGPGGN